MNVDHYQITSGFEIRKTPYDLDRAKIISNLSEHHWQSLKGTEFWAVISGPDVSDSLASKMINTLLFSFWVVGPIRATTFFKFIDYKTVSIIHDQFHHNEKDQVLECTEERLNQTASFYKELMGIYRRNRRLQTAMVSTFYGCVTIQWKVAFICFGAALESMLTYERDPGITKRLAKSYACLTEQKKRSRNRVFREFVRLYGIRSRLIHGEFRWLRNPDHNLTLLSNFSGLLRNLWQTVLSNKTYCMELDKGDQSRKRFFRKFEAGYIPPKVIIRKR